MTPKKDVRAELERFSAGERETPIGKQMRLRERVICLRPRGPPSSGTSFTMLPGPIRVVRETDRAWFGLPVENPTLSTALEYPKSAWDEVPCGPVAREATPSTNIYWRDIRVGSRVELRGPPGSQSYIVDGKLGAYWTGGESGEAQRALDAWAKLGRRPPEIGPMPEDISGVAGLGPLERPRVGKSGVRSLAVSNALDILEDQIADERRAVHRYRELARELDKAGFPKEAQDAVTISMNEARHAQMLENIRLVVRRKD